jgi:membrane associated rhomboid family serine protease
MVGAFVIAPLVMQRFRKASEIDHLNHVVGFLAGLGSGWILRRQTPPSSKKVASDGEENVMTVNNVS